MISTDDKTEQVVDVQCIGTFYTMNGKYKVLTIIVKCDINNENQEKKV